MYEDEFDEENERANKPDENPMTLPTIKKRRYADNGSHFGEYNNMDKVWLQKSIMEDDDEDLMQETHRDNITNLLEECLIEVDLDWKDEEEV
jgi:hypothetical protein